MTSGKGQICDICLGPVTDGCGAYDEDDRFWCVPCMLKWEAKEGRRWSDGVPFAQANRRQIGKS